MERKGAGTKRGYCGEFVLIDLFSQREAVYRYVDGWTNEEVLNWMQQYGEVSGSIMLGIGLYHFCSNFGRRAHVRIVAEERFEINPYRGDIFEFYVPPDQLA